MMLSLKKVIWMCTAVGVIATTGCNSTPKPVFPPDVEVDVVKTEKDISCENDKFLLTGEQTGFSLKLQKENANIRDLASFVICLYRKEIQQKLRSGEKLGPHDTQILELCLSVQVMALRLSPKTGQLDLV